MGKKTNWTVAEDQALCRAWINASEAVLPQSIERKAATFWSVVYDLFHAETESTVERPLTGLKVRWTRINRDVQKFALIFADVQSTGMKTPQVELNDGNAVELPAVAAAVVDTNDDKATTESSMEQQYVLTAKQIYLSKESTKFTFESCWRILRYSPKWISLLSNTSGMSSSSLTPTSASALLGDDGDAEDTESTSPSTIQASSIANALTGSKRSAASMGSSDGTSSSNTAGRLNFVSQLQASLNVLTEQVTRQMELLEERNAIALFSTDIDMVSDHEARVLLQQLKQKYMKRMRLQSTSADATDQRSITLQHMDI